MAIPASKSELTAVLKQESEKFFRELESIPAALTREKTVTGNISVCDVVAYQIGWGQLLINWYKTGKKGKIPALPAEHFKWNQLGDLAAHFYHTYQNETYESLLKQFSKTVKEVEQIIAENTDHSLYSLNVFNWTGDKWPLGRWINVNTSSPYKSARTKVRSWKKLKGLK